MESLCSYLAFIVLVLIVIIVRESIKKESFASGGCGTCGKYALMSA